MYKDRQTHTHAHTHICTHTHTHTHTHTQLDRHTAAHTHTDRHEYFIVLYNSSGSCTPTTVSLKHLHYLYHVYLEGLWPHFVPYCLAVTLTSVEVSHRWTEMDTQKDYYSCNELFQNINGGNYGHQSHEPY